VSAAVVCVLLVPGLSLARAEDETTGSSWTIALYVDADCNLEMYWESPSLEYLLNIPANDNLKIVAFVDWLSVEGTDVIEISGGTSQVVVSYPEMNYGDGATFAWFLEQVGKDYASDHLVVIPWDHGSAWKGFCWDETSGNDRITLDEMGDAIVSAGVYIDILAFDACSCSSIETAYEAASTGLVGLLVASEELVAGDGFPYDLMFTPVALDTSRTPEQVARDMLAGWVASYEPLEWAWYSTLGIVDLSVIAESLSTMAAWTQQMYEGLPANSNDYRMALTMSYYVSCGSHYQVDLVDLGRHLMADPDLAGDTELMETTKAMVELIEEAVIDVYNPDRTAACGGVSIYWGSHNQAWRTSYNEYSTVDYAEDSGWSDFLIQYNLLTCGWMRIGK
jgi:hypothetical protein